MNRKSSAVISSLRTAGIILAALALAAPASALGPITEFPLPNSGGWPSDIIAGPDGNLWFADSGHGTIGRMTPRGEVAEVPIDSYYAPNALAVGPDGRIWVAAMNFDWGGGEIARVSPEGFALEEFPVNAACEIVPGPDGNLWFTTCSESSVGRITPAGVVTMFPIPETHGGYATSITAGPDGNLWFTAPYLRRIGRVTTAGSVVEFALPAGSGDPGSIVVGPDANLWFAEGDRIGRVTPSGEMVEFPVPATLLARGPEGDLWFADSVRGAIGRLSIENDHVAVAAETVVSSADSYISSIAAGPDGNVWYADGRRNLVGRLSVCSPQSVCLGGRFEISAAWAGGGSSGAGKPASLTSNAGAFWFFDPSNLEVFVKILDSCRGSGTFNVYVNGLTHLGVTVTVTDKQTGTSKTFVHPDGAPFSLLFDGSTFACP